MEQEPQWHRQNDHGRRRRSRRNASRPEWESNGPRRQSRTIDDDPQHICYYYDRAVASSYEINEDDPSIADMSQQELIRHDIRQQRRKLRRKKPHRPGLELFPKLKHFVSPKHNISSLKQYSDETSSTANTTHDGNHEDEDSILRVRQLSTTLTPDAPTTSLLQLQVAPHRPMRRPAVPLLATPPLKSSPEPTASRPPLCPPPQKQGLPPTPPRVRFLPDDQSSVPWDQRLDEIKSILKPSTFGHPAEKHTTPVRIRTIKSGSSHIPKYECEYEYEAEEPRALFDMEDSFLESVAAIVIQTSVRRFLAVRAVVRMILSEEHDHRTMRPRSMELANDDSLEFFHLAARIIQMTWFRYVRNKTAATTIQRVFRGYWARDCWSIDHYCATTIQALGRGYLVRLVMRMKPRTRPRQSVRDLWMERAKDSSPVSPISPYG